MGLKSILSGKDTSRPIKLNGESARGFSIALLGISNRHKNTKLTFVKVWSYAVTLKGEINAKLNFSQEVKDVAIIILILLSYLTLFLFVLKSEDISFNQEGINLFESLNGKVEPLKEKR